MRRIIPVMLVALVMVSGCETLRGGFLEPEGEEEESPSELAQEIAKEVEEIRNRSAEPAISLVAGDPQEGAGEGLSDAVAEEWSDVSALLFGAEHSLGWKEGGARRLARYHAAENTVIYDADGLETAEGRWALAVAVNEAIEFGVFGAMEAPESVDGWFAREILSQSGPQFVAALQRARAEEQTVDADGLAKRPEIAALIPVVGTEVGEVREEDAEVGFEENLRALIQREALVMGAALFRAGGWSGVEWGRIEPTDSSNYAVRPDRWLGGEGKGQWAWPEEYLTQREQTGWTEVRRGLMGPAVVALWMSGVVDRRAARSLYSGYLSDAYRVEESPDGEGRSLHWLSAWQTPHEAQEVAQAVESALRHYHGEDEVSFRVAVQGVTVAVVVYTQAYDPELMNQEVELLSGARFVIVPDEKAPIEYVPTLLEEYVEVAEASTLDEEAWKDEAAGWTVSTEALEGYQLQKSDEAYVRWFAQHPDSTLVQWTTELLNPLRPEFASPAYLEELEAVFTASLSPQQEPHVVLKQEPVDPTIELDLVGEMEGRPLALKVWQWRRGDVLVSFSVQGPEETFGDRLSEVEAVVESLTEYQEAVGEGRRSRSETEDEGIIEFRLEEE